MIQFDLDVWLKNPSRKLCTRNGLPARIVCWNRKIGLTASGDIDDFPIVALIDCEDTAGEFVLLVHKNGKNIYIKYVFPWVRSLFNKLNLRYNKVIYNIF